MKVGRTSRRNDIRTDRTRINTPPNAIECMVISLWMCNRVECVCNAEWIIFAECGPDGYINSDGAGDINNADNLLQLQLHDKEVPINWRRIYLCEDGLWWASWIYLCVVLELVILECNPPECDGPKPDNACSIW